MKATLITTNKEDNKRSEKSFAVDATKDDNSGSHLNSLRNCVNRLETQLNQYLTQIIEDENESGVGQSGAAASATDTQPSSDLDEIPKKTPTRSADNVDNGRQSHEPKRKKCKK